MKKININKLKSISGGVFAWTAPIYLPQPQPPQPQPPQPPPPPPQPNK